MSYQETVGEIEARLDRIEVAIYRHRTAAHWTAYASLMVDAFILAMLITWIILHR